MIIYRFYFEGIGLTDEWWKAFSGLSKKEQQIAKPIIEKNDFSDIYHATRSKKVQKVLSYYRITREEAEKDFGR